MPVATVGNAEITLVVTPAATGGVATSYDATCTSSDGGTTGLGSDPTTTVVVSGLDNGHSYTCTVIASNTDGPSVDPSPASNAVTPTSTKPGRPAAPTASAGNAQITVDFSAPPDGGSAITSFTAACTSLTGAPGSNTGGSTPITVGGLTNGKSYTCTVLATNGNGGGDPSPPSNAVIPVAPTTAPGKPAVPLVIAGDSTLKVTFSAPADGGKPITLYTVRCTDGNSTLLNTTSTVTPQTFNAVNGVAYTCTVSATNANGEGLVSDKSDPVTPATSGTAPGAPTNVEGTPGDRQISVTFIPPVSDGGNAIFDFTARCTSTNGGATASGVDTQSPIVVFNLDNGKSYTCTVTARNALGTSSPSAASAPAVPNGRPSAPPQPSVAGGDRRITVSFGAPFNGGSVITGYVATCTSSNGGGLRSGATSPIVITGLVNGVTYSCNVTASNKNGAGPSSSPSKPVVPDRGPDAPAKPAVTAGNAQIKVAFHAPGNGGSPITGYTAACTSSNGGRRGTKSGPTTPLIVSSLTNGRTYTCTVAAQNARGLSLDSPPSLAVVPTSPVSATAVAHGFRLFAGDGGVFTFGTDRSFGSAAGVAQHLVVGMASTNNTQGYWLVATDGGIFSFGNAHFYGSTGAIRLNQPIVGMSPTPSGLGYWLVARDGGVFSYGDARFYGSTGAIHLNQPIVGMASTPTGRGYWMVASDGGIFSFGDARFFGSSVGSTSSPVVGMATTAQGHGYWVAAADGSVFHYGDAAALGSVTARALRLPVRGIESTPTGRGYWLATGDGGVFTFGDAPFVGWPGPLTLLASIRGVSR